MMKRPNDRAPAARHRQREKFGGSLFDIGSHDFEQFLTYTGATDAMVTQALIGILPIENIRSWRTTVRPR
jgi:predicted dehydrogenase